MYNVISSLMLIVLLTYYSDSGLQVRHCATMLKICTDSEKAREKQANQGSLRSVIEQCVCMLLK